MVWWGTRNGRVVTNAVRSATRWIRVVSRASRRVSAGRMVVRRRSSFVPGPCMPSVRRSSKERLHGFPLHATRDCAALITILIGGAFQTQHQIDVRSPAFGSSSHQRLAGQDNDLRAFVSNWEAEQVPCPQGHTSRAWIPRACTWASEAPRQLTVRPQAQHVAIQAARQHQETAELTAQNTL
jgi:hypothetical protein